MEMYLKKFRQTDGTTGGLEGKQGSYTSNKNSNDSRFQVLDFYQDIFKKPSIGTSRNNATNVELPVPGPESVSGGDVGGRDPGVAVSPEPAIDVDRLQGRCITALAIYNPFLQNTLK